MPTTSANDSQRIQLGPGLDDPAIQAVLQRLAEASEVERLVLFGSRARGEARPHSDLDLLVILQGSLTPEREKLWRRRVRDLLLPLLPVDLDLLISDAATSAHWAGSRWHVLGHIPRKGVPLHAS
ncbi:MAG: nucleotidyltransferase family protein [Cyanobium sp.]